MNEATDYVLAQVNIGPTTLRTHFPPPGPGGGSRAVPAPLHSPEDWTCPV